MSATHGNVSQETGHARRKFYEHLGIYLVVNAVLCALDILTGTDKLWFYWVLGGWGIGIVAHAMSAFGVTHDRTHQSGPTSSSPPTNTPTAV